MIGDKVSLDLAFNPRGVAVVGAKKVNDFMWLRTQSTFKGPLYSVQIDESEVAGIEAAGFKNYKSLVDIPGPVDYVLVAVPRAVAPRVMVDAVQKRVGGAVAFFTSGFAETETEEGIRLQKAIVDIARQGGVNVVGPNCMGLFCPGSGIRQSAEQYTGESGPVGLISQSGTHAIQFSLLGYANGIKISKSASMGNGVVLDSPDYIDYLAQDPDTKLIAMYLEGPKDGRRLFEALRRAARRKPVVIWKGGQTEAGARAIYSHTGSLASPISVWNAVVKQAGALQVDSLDELVDTVKAILYAKPARSYRAGLVAISGGQSVIISDTFAREGIQVPLLNSESYSELSTFYNTVGGSYKNPMDMSPNMGRVELVQRVLDILGRDPNVDAVIYEINIGMGFARRGTAYIDSILDMLRTYQDKLDKPFLTVVNAAHREVEGFEMRKRVQEAGLVTYGSFQRAARALRHLADYARIQTAMQEWLGTFPIKQTL